MTRAEQRLLGECHRAASPAVANGVVYVGSSDGKVYALNAATGAQEWAYTTGANADSSPAVANGVVYVGSEDGNVYAFSLPGGTSDGVRRARGQEFPGTARAQISAAGGHW
jgi:outer membrane protein assembly factor BamB